MCFVELTDAGNVVLWCNLQVSGFLRGILKNKYFLVYNYLHFVYISGCFGIIWAQISFAWDKTWIFQCVLRRFRRWLVFHVIQLEYFRAFWVLNSNVLCVSWNWLKPDLWFCDVISRFLDFCPEYWKINIFWYTSTLISYVLHRGVCSRKRDSFLMQDFVKRASQSNFHDKFCGNFAVLWCNFQDPRFLLRILKN